MQVRKAGEKVDYVVTFLEMPARPNFARPHLFGKSPSALIHAVNPPGWYFLSLYDAVGRDYEWVDWHAASAEELAAFVGDEAVQLYTFLRDGWPHGFFMLDTRESGVVDLAYFGLVPEAVGKGLGTWLLETAIHMAWDVPGCAKLTVNTCTLDHPRALAHYQKHGFQPVSQETRSRVLTRDWDPARFT